MVILNWNGWKYTLPCLESVLRSDYKRLTVIVCDNGSRDESLSAMKSWTAEHKESPLSHRLPNAGLARQPRRKTLSEATLDEDSTVDSATSDGRDVIFLYRTTNEGYAAGNNSGIRLALTLGADYVWILNNDTLVEATAARYLVNYMQCNQQIGLCGTTIRSYDRPDRIQVLGGCCYNKWTARPTPLIHAHKVEKRLSYVAGASVCASRQFLDSIGLMCEEYFLYSEEMDWATRAKNHTTLGYCHQAVVYHKDPLRAQSSEKTFREYCSVRASLLLAKKFWPIRLLTILPWTLSWALARLLRGRPLPALTIVAAVLDELGLGSKGLQSLLGLPEMELSALKLCRASAARSSLRDSGLSNSQKE